MPSPDCQLRILHGKIVFRRTSHAISRRLAVVSDAAENLLASAPATRPAPSGWQFTLRRPLPVGTSAA